MLGWSGVCHPQTGSQALWRYSFGPPVVREDSGIGRLMLKESNQVQRTRRSHTAWVQDKYLVAPICFLSFVNSSEVGCFVKRTGSVTGAAGCKHSEGCERKGLMSTSACRLRGERSARICTAKLRICSSKQLLIYIYIVYSSI